MDVISGTSATLLCFIIGAAVIGNTSLWIIIWKFRDLRTVTNMFILVLSAVDWLVSVINVPIAVATIIVGDWPFSETACTVVGYFNMLFLVTSVMSLCNISINRYFMICRPYSVRDIYTKRNAVLMIVGVCVISITLSSLPLLGWGKYSYIPQHKICFCDWKQKFSFSIFMIACCFGGPFSIMSVCNASILRRVKASKTSVSKAALAQDICATDTPSKEHISATTFASAPASPTRRQRISPLDGSVVRANGQSSVDKKEQRLTMSLILVVVMFVVSLLPYCISMVLMMLLPDIELNLFHRFSIILGYANSSFNAVIYGVMNTQFRKAFEVLYCNWRKK